MARPTLESKIMKRDDARFTVDAAINVYNFLEAVDINSPMLIRAGLNKDMEQTMVDCVEILRDCITQLKKK
jgi:hypothetical protein